MTDEQIRQNAEEYAYKVAPAKSHKSGIPSAINHAVIRAFIDGAKWADEHTKSPWISVEDRLPDKWKRIKVQQGLLEECYSWITKYVFVIKDGWETPEKAFYDYEGKIWWSEFVDNIENLFGEPTHWMSIPELEKGE